METAGRCGGQAEATEGRGAEAFSPIALIDVVLWSH